MNLGDFVALVRQISVKLAHTAAQVDEAIDRILGGWLDMMVSAAQAARDAALSARDAAQAARDAAGREADRAAGAWTSIHDALDDLPPGATLVVDDLTTGGTTAALSAEQGLVLKGLATESHENLLDNWKFIDPIDQRQGYIKPDGAGGWATASAGETGAVRGYAGSGQSVVYCIDRWANYCSQAYIKILDDGIQITKNSDNDTSGVLTQCIDHYESLPGKTVTFSALVKDVHTAGNAFINIAYGPSANRPYTTIARAPIPAQVDLGYLATLTVTMPAAGYAGSVSRTVPNAGIHVGTKDDPGDYMTVVACKLELGSTQTLAHLEPRSNYGDTLPVGVVDAGNGQVWVLNDPPPNRALELAKCQRYALMLFEGRGVNAPTLTFGPPVNGNAALTNFSFLIPIPAMRAIPTIAVTGAANSTAANGYFLARRSGGDIVPGCEFSWTTMGPRYIKCSVSKGDGTAFAGYDYQLVFMGAAQIFLSADL